MCFCVILFFSFIIIMIVVVVAVYLWIHWELAKKTTKYVKRKNQVVGAVFRQTTERKKIPKKLSHRNFLYKYMRLRKRTGTGNKVKKNNRNNSNKSDIAVNCYKKNRSYLSDTLTTFLFTVCFSLKINCTLSRCV